MRRKANRARVAPWLEALESRALLSTDLTGSPSSTPAASESLLVRFAANTPGAVEQADLGAVGAHVIRTFPDGPTWIALDPGTDRAAALGRLRSDPEVLYAEVDSTIQSQAIIPNNPLFTQQWGLNNPNDVDIDAPEAWSVTTGNPATVVAVIDTGIDLSNPAFAGRLWVNPNPSDMDGRPDDVNGWNFVTNTGNVQDDNGHGTHVSGILAATGNNGNGVAGVDWGARIMPVKVLDANGNGTIDAAVAGIFYAVQHGARVINASWGGGLYSPAIADAIRYADLHGVVFVTAAGNDGLNTDFIPSYPGSFRLPNEITVAAVDASGYLASFSDYGAYSIDLAAPGVNIVSTVPGGFQVLSGTSMAAPYVSGVVALLAGIHPEFSAEQLVQQVLATTKPLPGLAGRTITGGIVDAARALGVNGSASTFGAQEGLAGTPTSPSSYPPPLLLTTILPVRKNRKRPRKIASAPARTHAQPKQVAHLVPVPSGAATHLGASLKIGPLLRAGTPKAGSARASENVGLLSVLEIGRHHPGAILS